MKLLVALVLALTLATPALAATHRASESDLESKLVCQTCHETLDESNSPQANQMKAEIARRIAQGWTEKQILDEMVANYGPSVLSTPATHGFDLLAWLLPIGGILIGAAGIAVGAWVWSRNRSDPDEPASPGYVPLAREDEERLDAELARLDA